MAKRTVNKIEGMTDSEQDNLKKDVQEYIKRREDLEGQIEGIKEDLKTLDDEFAEKVDLRTLKQMIRILKIEAEIAHRDAADTFREALTDPST
jgi:uncharacterized protein (UPF0335 family)